MAPTKKKPKAGPKKTGAVQKKAAAPNKPVPVNNKQPSRGYGASPPSEWMKLLFAVLVVAIIGTAVALATSVAAGNPPATPPPGTPTATPGTMMPTPAPSTPTPTPTPGPVPPPPPLPPPTPVDPPGPVSALTVAEIGLIVGAVVLVVLGAALLLFRAHDRMKYGVKLSEYTAVNRSDDAESVTSDPTENTSLMRSSLSESSE